MRRGFLTITALLAALATAALATAALGTAALAIAGGAPTASADPETARAESDGPHATVTDGGIDMADSATGDAGSGFTYKNVKFKGRSGIGMTEVIGEMTNGGRKTYKVAMFKISVYDGEGALTSVCDIMISNFAPGQTRSWDAYCEDVPRRLKFKISFESGF